MSIEIARPSLEFASFRREFAEIFRFGSESAAHRTGFLVRATLGNKIGYGEASPLPNVSKDSFAEIASWIARGESALWTAWRDSRSALPPALRFALDSALLEIADSDEPAEAKRAIRLNAIVAADGTDPRAKFRELWRKGFRTFKFKISPDRSQATLELLALLKATADGPYFLRLDGNGAFQPNNILNVTPALLSYPIEYWEDPLPLGDLWSWKYFRKESPFALALDGPLDSVAAVEAAVADNLADVYILKPTVLGGLANLDRAIAAVEAGGKRWVVTSTLETEIGIRAILVHLSRTGKARAPQGLASAALFRESFLEEVPELVPDYRRLAGETSWLASLDWRRA